MNVSRITQKGIYPRTRTPMAISQGGGVMYPHLIATLDYKTPEIMWFMKTDRKLFSFYTN